MPLQIVAPRGLRCRPRRQTDGRARALTQCRARVCARDLITFGRQPMKITSRADLQRQLWQQTRRIVRARRELGADSQAKRVLRIQSALSWTRARSSPRQDRRA